MTTKSSYFEGYKIALRNAKSLSEVADRAADTKAFGIACSLNILAAEESIKAVFMLTKHFNNETEINDFDKIFKDHKTKHEHLLGIFVANRVFLKIQNETIEKFMILIKIVESLPEPQQTQLKQKFEILYDHAARVKKRMQNQIPIETVKNWLEGANLEKNRGFYVDKGNEIWYDPKDFTQHKYETERLFTQSFIKDAEEMIEIFDTTELIATLQKIQNGG